MKLPSYTLEQLREAPHLSYSALNTYLNICQLQYFFRYVEKIEPAVGSTMALSLSRAIEIFVDIVEAPHFTEFMSLPAYKYLISVPRAKM